MDFSKWAIVAHKDDTGFGRQAKDLRTVLGLGRHLIIPSERLQDYPPENDSEQILDPQASEAEVRARLDGLQGIIFPERHSWHPRLLPLCRELGVKSVCIPMWEWFKGFDKEWANCDFFVCPSNWTASVISSYGFTNHAVIPPTMDLTLFPYRQVVGTAKTFIHCAGLVDFDDRKGTRESIEAFKKVKNRDIRLIVRMQKEAKLPKLDSRIDLHVGNLDNPADLYKDGDVAIQPSKMEGIGFMVLEPMVTGMPVITIDYPPMNEYVTTEELLVRKRWFKRKAYAANWVKHAHLRLPDVNDLAAKIRWCCDNDLSAISERNRTKAEEMCDPVQQKAAWSRVLSKLVG